jgi:hypothetical protein
MNYTGDSYITNQEYDEALRLYYNGLDYTKAIKPAKQKQSWYNPVVAKELMLEGERFERLEIPGKRVDHIIITNLGRILNTNTGTMSSVYITKFNIIANVGGTSHTYRDLYRDSEFDYDYETFKNNFLNNKWPIKKYTQYTK